MARVFVVCAADFAAERFAVELLASCDLLVAADGGLRHVQAAGARADVVVGDFDSLGYVPEGAAGGAEAAAGADAASAGCAADARVLRYPCEKDASDFELALRAVCEWASGEGTARDAELPEVLVFGALGGRLDQTLAALQTAVSFASGFAIAFISPRETVHVLASGTTLTLAPSTARYVSVLSATDESHGVSIRGLKYEFEGTLHARGSLGLSNEFIGQTAHITATDGTLFVVEQY